VEKKVQVAEEGEKDLTTHHTGSIISIVQTTISLFDQILHDALSLWQLLGVDKVG
jgi:hypothetical protein